MLVLLPLAVEEHVIITLAAPIIVLEVSESFPPRIRLWHIFVELFLLHILSDLVALASLIAAFLHHPPGRWFVLNILLKIVGFSCQRDSGLLENWLWLTGSLLFERGINELSRLEKIAGGRDFVVGTHWRTLVAVEYSVLPLHFAGVVGVGVEGDPLLGAEGLVASWIVVLHVVANHRVCVSRLLFTRFFLSNFNHLFGFKHLFLLQLNFQMVNPINVLFLLDLEIIHFVYEFQLGLGHSIAHPVLRLFILPTHPLEISPVALLYLSNRSHIAFPQLANLKFI